MKLLAALIFFGAVLSAGEGAPDNYNGLPFGARDSALRAQYPSSENHRFVLSKEEGPFPPGVTAWRLLHKKGAVDSVRFYFAGGRFAMAVEFYYPGREFRDKAYQSATARFGQFVGAGDNAWRRKGPYVVLLSFNRVTKITTLTFTSSAYADKLRSPSESEAIDAELRALQSQLDSLSATP